MKEAIEYIQKLIDENNQKIKKAGEKRLSCFDNYAIFYIQDDMEGHAHLKMLEPILEILTRDRTKAFEALAEEYHTPIIVAELKQLKERMKVAVLWNKMSFSTSQGANLYEVIQKNVSMEYVRDDYGATDWVIRILTGEK
jgi:hypothetical protein